MRFALQSFSPRAHSLPYDSLQQATGCQPAAFIAPVLSLASIETVCVFDHDPSSLIFNQSDQVSGCVGPLTIGQPVPWPSRWCGWVAAAGCRYGQLLTVALPSNGIGAVNPLYPSTKPAKLSFGFTSAGQIATAIQKSVTQIEISWIKSDLSPASAAWIGIAPLLFNTGLLHIGDKPNDTDLVCFYIRRDQPNSLYARFERDGFLVERVIHNLLQSRIVNLLSAEAINGRLVIYARDAYGRDITITTVAFPVSIQPDHSTLSQAIASGAYSNVAKLTTMTGDKAKFTPSFVSGVYADVAKQADANKDASTLDISITSGEYL